MGRKEAAAFGNQLIAPSKETLFIKSFFCILACSSRCSKWISKKLISIKKYYTRIAAAPRLDKNCETYYYIFLDSYNFK
jgi:hypothetical protein